MTGAGERTTGDATLDLLLSLASWLFLVGVLMVAASAVPSVTQRYPKVMLLGFLVAVLAAVLAALSAVVLG
jgi:hypothetical protein